MTAPETAPHVWVAPTTPATRVQPGGVPHRGLVGPVTAAALVALAVSSVVWASPLLSVALVCAALSGSAAVLIPRTRGKGYAVGLPAGAAMWVLIGWGIWEVLG